LGAGLGSAIEYHLSSRFLILVEKWKGFPPPEERLYGAMIAGPSFVAGALLFGWTGQYSSIHWIVPEIGMILIGTSVGMNFMSQLGYLMDVYL
jgi:DHA1 family multidrug resistance protein-like MFS transporter